VDRAIRRDEDDLAPQRDLTRYNQRADTRTAPATSNRSPIRSPGASIDLREYDSAPLILESGAFHMMRSNVVLVSGLSLGLSALALAQPPAPAAPASPPAPATPAPAAQPAQPAKAVAPATPQAEPKKDAPATAATPAAYPAYVTKQLWAANDFRGKKAPALQVEEWRGEKPDLKNKTILVDFWGISCPPCRMLIPELEGWQAKYKDDLVVIGLSAETPKSIANFEDLRGGKIKYTMAYDPALRAYKDVGVQGIPHVLVISSDGIVRWQGFPLANEDKLTEEVMKQIIEADKAARAKSGGDKVAAPATSATPAAKPAAEAKPDDKAPQKQG
jgi:thiol-disulfide isomerase/thioredoxin